jgi:hypothetical protein
MSKSIPNQLPKNLPGVRSKQTKPLKVSEDISKLKWSTSSEKSTVQIPKWVLTSHSWRSLTHAAKTALMALCYQNWGDNNGLLELTRPMVREFGISNPNTLSRVKQELLDSGLVTLTLKGQFMNPGGRPDKFALAWHNVPDNNKTRKLGIGSQSPTFLKPSTINRKKKAAAKNKTPCTHVDTQLGTHVDTGLGTHVDTQ